ncbi:hypothetical protein [Taibaiella chishuiensis]|uniref:Uncharacterized protein n=1 Tax=Taibaiella chishuiensis TaxID=1434707 RepID=A0A2P8D0G0_9BACT|nr:hypothetical protein [Taibaiella chishuiensis]PSK90697.1 hypothetical protein B0I18_107107 [Taibaiella chishuiensis]
MITRTRKHRYAKTGLAILALFAAVTTSSAQAPLKNRDTLVLKESRSTDDIPVNEYLQEQLQATRQNFKKINSTTRWTRVKERSLTETTEGGYALFYYQGQLLQKIVARQYGEMFQQLDEYYLLNGQLSFVLERTYRYNRPIYYDSAAMKANQDTEAFDFDSSKIEENRCYFLHGRLAHLLNNQDCGAPFAADFLQEEEKRIKAAYSDLLRLGKK